MSKTQAIEKSEAESVAPVREDLPVFVPAVDIYEKDDAVLVRCDLPGVNEADLEITLEDNVLTLNGMQQAAVPDGHEALAAEYQTGVYQRSFRIAQEVDRDQIKASMKHGVLDLRLPKSRQGQPRRIEVNVNS